MVCDNSDQAAQVLSQLKIIIRAAYSVRPKLSEPHDRTAAVLMSPALMARGRTRRFTARTLSTPSCPTLSSRSSGESLRSGVLL